MNIPYVITLWLLAATPLFAPLAVLAATIAGVAKVVDGDTLIVSGTKIRLTGIDAPETDQICLDGAGNTYACGVMARDNLIRLIENNPLICSGEEIDIYKRQLMTCFADDTDLNGAMVSAGWALAFQKYSKIYVKQELEARMLQSGLWSGAFIASWDWRRRDAGTEILGSFAVPLDAQELLPPKQVESASLRANCNIKGNISQKGERVYHMPSQRDYRKTSITEKNGERWFCSEDEAQAAGWRHAQK